MINRYYMEMVRRAVRSSDSGFLLMIAQQLSDCEEAKRILRLKGYGEHGMATAATARLVPTAKGTR